MLLTLLMSRISRAAPRTGLDTGSIVDDTEIFAGTDPAPNFPISQDISAASPATIQSSNSPFENLYATDGFFIPAELETGPDISKNNVQQESNHQQDNTYLQDNIFQIAQAAPFSEPLYASCDLWLHQCQICRQSTPISLVCELAEKVTRKAAGDTLCTQGSKEKCVPFDVVSNNGMNAIAYVSHVRTFGRVPYTSLPQYPGKMIGTCRQNDVEMDCKICTGEKRSDCTPSLLKKTSDMTQVCNDKDGCTRYDGVD